jgi:ribosomal-protein-alanine N-acetyltransferase
MQSSDVDAVVAIERDVFALPWSRRAFEVEVGDEQISVPLVARLGGRVVGYAVAWKVADELHIGNLAVARAAQRRGIARALLAELLRLGETSRLAFATLEVRESNARALSLYERNGFRPVAVRRGYYPDNGEDALVMLKDFDRNAG